MCIAMQMRRRRGLLPTRSTLQVLNRHQNNLVMITTMLQKQPVFHGLVHGLTSLEYEVIYLLLY